MSAGWQRVTRANPCPVCKHDRWCCIGETAVNCMRVESAKPARNGGWMHPLDAKAAPTTARKPAPPPPQLTRPDRLLTAWEAATTAAMLRTYAAGLGVSPDALRALGAVYSASHDAWAYPMRAADGQVLGIRLRSDSRKWTVTGSREGLFYGELGADVLVCEGPTDTAAALTLGFNAVGRPSCSGTVWHVGELARLSGIARLIVVADDDGPGRRGALRMIDALKIPSKVLALPCKDIRRFVQLGGTRKLLTDMLAAQEWSKP